MKSVFGALVLSAVLWAPLGLVASAAEDDAKRTGKPLLHVYAATTAGIAKRQGSVPVAGITWRCEKDSCTASTRGPSRP